VSTAIDNRLDGAQRAARLRIVSDLSDSKGQPIIEFCFELIAWILTGQKKPVGAPTDRVRSAVRAAINVGLRENYGSEDPADVDQNVLSRRNSL